MSINARPSDTAEQQQHPAATHFRAILLCGAYIGVSALLIRFNKYLMQADRFPYSMALTALHMGCSLLFCTVLYWARPSAFPGMVDAAGRRADLLRWFVPIGICFAISLYTSNQAYLYCNVAFLQFMKEGNVMISFLMSCAVGLQVMNRVKLAVIVWVVGSSTLCIGAELHFVFLGFAFQLASQLAECARAVMGECVLSGANLRLDPLTYTLFSAPTCLAVLLVGNAVAWDPEIPHRAAIWWHYLLPNAMLAFILNVIVAAVIKETSAVGFTLTGVVKDIVIVLVSAHAFGETVTQGQSLGFSLALMGILFWSMMKTAPESYPVKLVEGILQLPKPEQGEQAVLLPKKAGSCKV